MIRWLNHKARGNRNNNPTGIDFYTDHRDVNQELFDVNNVLKVCTDEERAKFLRYFFISWRNAWMSDSIFRETLGDFQRAFGLAYSDFLGRRLMVTLTSDGRQLRVWWGIPHQFTDISVDWNGPGILLNVWGEPESVKTHLDAILSADLRLTEIKLEPSHVTVFGLRQHPPRKR